MWSILSAKSAAMSPWAPMDTTTIESASTSADDTALTSSWLTRPRVSWIVSR